MIRSRVVYTLLLYLLTPWVIVRLWRRGRREPAYREHVAERFGRGHGPTRPGCIWIHAVSVGETRAAQPIVERILREYPDRAVLLTHMTPTGRDTGRQLFGERVLQCYLPYDYPGSVARFLERHRPALGLVMETEVWFNLLAACARRRIPVYLVNARMSEKSRRGYARLGPLVAQGLQGFRRVAAQSAADAQRFQALGATRVAITGNVKFDIAPPAQLVALGCAWREAIGTGRPVFLAASTRDGEEELLLGVLDRIGIPGLLTIIVPRHPQRFDAVARMLAERGIACLRRSEGGLPGTDCAVWLGDSMGEMSAYYAACDVAFVGGSLQPYGAHNLVEACALAKPVIVGPSVFNFQEAVDLGVAAGAVIQVGDAAGVAEQVDALLRDATRARRVGAAGAAFAHEHRGAVDRLFAEIDWTVVGRTAG